MAAVLLSHPRFELVDNGFERQSVADVALQAGQHQIWQLIETHRKHGPDAVPAVAANLTATRDATTTAPAVATAAACASPLDGCNAAQGAPTSSARVTQVSEAPPSAGMSQSIRPPPRTAAGTASGASAGPLSAAVPASADRQRALGVLHFLLNAVAQNDPASLQVALAMAGARPGAATSAAPAKVALSTSAANKPSATGADCESAQGTAMRTGADGNQQDHATSQRSAHDGKCSATGAAVTQLAAFFERAL